MAKNGLKVWTAALALIIALTGCAREAAERLSPPTSSPALESESGEAAHPESFTHSIENKRDGPYLTGKMGDDFILPDATGHVYTKEELPELTQEELRIARNEIYARHGRTFKSDDLNQYFTGKSWYNGTIDPE